MILNRQAMEEFPFHGVFYQVETEKAEDGDLLGDQYSASPDGDLLGDDDDETVSDTDAGTTAGEVGETETSVKETIVLEKMCDIQRASELTSSGTLMADYEVYCPCEKGEKFPFDIRFNTKFRCDDYAIPVSGYVVGFEYSQLGGFHCRIKMFEI